MVAAVHRAARVVRGRLTAAAWAQLRSPRPGGRARRRAGHRDREGAGLALHALPRPDPVQGAERAAVAATGEGDGVAGAATRAAARRRDAPRHRGRVRVVQADAVPALTRRAEGELHVPGLGEPVQAHRGRLLHPRRALRPGPVPDLRLAGPRAGRAARAPARAASRRQRGARCRSSPRIAGQRQALACRGAAGGAGVARSGARRRTRLVLGRAGRRSPTCTSIRSPPRQRMCCCASSVRHRSTSTVRTSSISSRRSTVSWRSRPSVARSNDRRGSLPLTPTARRSGWPGCLRRGAAG